MAVRDSMDIGGIHMVSVRQAKHQHNVQKWTQIIS